MAESLLRPREVADRLAVSKSTVYRWFWKKKLKGVKFGETVRIKESSVEEMLADAAKDQEGAGKAADGPARLFPAEAGGAPGSGASGS